MTRRRRGEGSIRQRSDGRWEARVTIGYDAAGKQVRRSVYAASESECIKEKNKLLEQVGVLVDAENITVKEYSKRWLKFKSRGPLAVKPLTLQSYSDYINNHINPRLGRLKVTKVTPLHIDSLLMTMAEKGLAARTLGNARRVLNGMFRQAVKWKLIASNPVEAVDPPDRKLIKKAKVPNMRFHDLRHLYASLALREGLQLSELSERLGHYDPAFTLSTYTHVLEDSTGGAMTLAELTAGKEDIAKSDDSENDQTVN